MATVTVTKSVNQNIENAIKALKNKSVNIGWFPSSRYEDGTPVAYIATIQEYGYAPKNIPPRPFMRPTVIRCENQWKRLARGYASEIIHGKRTVEGALDLLGADIQAEVRRSIQLVREPVLKRRTIEARIARSKNYRRATKSQALGLTKPLVDTGYMLATVSHEIVEG